MRIVLDTNVLIAAFISRGSCAELLEHSIACHEVYASEYIMREFSRHLLNKFHYTEQAVDAASDLLRSRLKIVLPVSLPDNTCSDAADIPIIGTAVAAKCRCLITGDKALLTLAEFEGIDILAPGAFWKYENDSGR